MKGIGVTVILPVFNMSKYVGDAIQSILHQSYSDFEFIIVDDASTDATLNQIHLWEDKRIKVIRNEGNIGNYQSRNKALSIAKGKYIAVMDADDIALPDRLEKQVAYLENNSDVLAVGSDFVFTAGDVKKDIPLTYEAIKLALLEKNCFLHPSLMIRRDVIQQIGGYNEKYIYSSDYDLVCRLALKGKMENLQDKLMIYRWHESQISQLHRLEQGKYGREIRRNYQCAMINRYKRNNQAFVTEEDVAFSLLGKIIFYYTYASFSQNAYYEEMADEWLDELYNQIDLTVPPVLEEGLCGVGCGLVYLLRNGFVEGNEDEILGNIDRRLFGSLIFMHEEDKPDWYGWLCYFLRRLTKPRDEKEIRTELTFKQHSIYLLECLERQCLVKNILTENMVEKLNGFHHLKLCPEKTQFLLDLYAGVRLRKNCVPCEPIESKSITFVIPLRIDSKEREENLDMLLALLSRMEGVDILLLEGDSEPKYRIKKHYENVQYYFVEDHDMIFYRTKYLNWLIRKASSSVVGVWDTDVIAPECQIREAVDKIRSGEVIMAFPYDGRFYTLSSKDSSKVKDEQAYDFLYAEIENQVLMHGPHSVGGAFLVNKGKYLQAGGENENFYGWGPEDAERVKRMEILGYGVYFASGPLFHLYHPRKENSWFGSREVEIQNRSEFVKVCSMEQKHLWEYVESWPWVK